MPKPVLTATATPILRPKKPFIRAPDPEGPLPLDGTLEYVRTGSTQLDLVLGGGWAIGRISNVVGDRSSGKTLQAIEACANFAIRHSAEACRYGEAEAAFDEAYADNIGMPRGVTRPDEQLETVQEFDEDLQEWLEARSAKDGPCFYALDSLDALTDNAEISHDEKRRKAMKKGEEVKGSYGADKAKFLSSLFRKRVRLIADRRCHLMVISQLRDKMNVSFGETQTRSGGRALDFYASQIVWLRELGKLKRTVKGNERTVGMEVRARAKKNKVGIPFRECDYQVMFSYGVDDEMSMLEWLKSQKVAVDLVLGYEGSRKALLDARRAQDYDIIDDVADDLKKVTKARWQEIEAALKPPIQKYRRTT